MTGSDDFEVSHHPLIFVLELMAVNEVAASVSIEANKDLDGLAIVEENRIFPALLPREENPTSAAARLHLEGCAMDMDWMRGVTVGREAPKLCLTEGYLKVNTF